MREECYLLPEFLMGDPGSLFHPFILNAIKRLGASKVCFGIDTPFELMHVEVFKYHALLDGEVSKVSKEEKEQIMAGNIIRLFGLKIYKNDEIAYSMYLQRLLKQL